MLIFVSTLNRVNVHGKPTFTNEALLLLFSRNSQHALLQKGRAKTEHFDV